MSEVEYWFGYEQGKDGKMEQEPRAYFKCKEGDRWWLLAPGGFTQGDLVAEIDHRKGAGMEVPEAFKEALQRFGEVPKWSDAHGR